LGASGIAGLPEAELEPLEAGFTEPDAAATGAPGLAAGEVAPAGD